MGSKVKYNRNDRLLGIPIPMHRRPDLTNLFKCHRNKSVSAYFYDVNFEMRRQDSARFSHPHIKGKQILKYSLFFYNYFSAFFKLGERHFLGLLTVAKTLGLIPFLQKLRDLEIL